MPKTSPKAERLSYFKMRYPDDAILEYVVWKLPQPTVDRPHGYKYRYYYGKDGKRLVGYDNESGKGDHKHIGDAEHPYTFVSLEQLTKDFLTDVVAHRSQGGI
jgi:hypothetical protein